MMSETEQDLSVVSVFNDSLPYSKHSDPSAWKEQNVSRMTTGEFGIAAAAEKEMVNYLEQNPKIISPSNLPDGMTILRDQDSFVAEEQETREKEEPVEHSKSTHTTPSKYDDSPYRLLSQKSMDSDKVVERMGNLPLLINKFNETSRNPINITVTCAKRKA